MCFHVLNVFACNATLRLTRRVPIYKILIFTSEGFPAAHTPCSCSTLAWGQWPRPVSCMEVGTSAFSLLTAILAQHSCSYLTRGSGLLWGRFKEISETFFFMCSVFLLKNKVGGLQGFVFYMLLPLYILAPLQASYREHKFVSAWPSLCFKFYFW